MQEEKVECPEKCSLFDLMTKRHTPLDIIRNMIPTAVKAKELVLVNYLSDFSFIIRKGDTRKASVTVRDEDEDLIDAIVIELKAKEYFCIVDKSRIVPTTITVTW